jgi:hypothetical protein
MGLIFLPINPIWNAPLSMGGTSRLASRFLWQKETGEAVDPPRRFTFISSSRSGRRRG